MQIIRAKCSGFCFGVKNAIRLAEDLAKMHDRVFTRGTLIHNKQVTNNLTKKGIRVIDDLKSLSRGDIVIVRSHGEPPSFYKEADKLGIRIEDATCPFVAKIHNLVSEAKTSNRNIIIIGDKKHPEVIGINGCCDNRAVIMNSAEEASEYHLNDPFIVAQTTLERHTLDEVVNVLIKNGIAPEVHDTICHATKDRQNAAAKLADNVDAMIVIGDKNSSNSRKLYDICLKHCNQVFFIENIDDLPLKELIKCNRMGVAAGASTPERIIKEVVTEMSDNTNNENITMADFMDEIDASIKLPHPGDIITGKVAQVSDDEVIINLGCKKDGILSSNEVSMENGQKLTDLFKVDDEVKAKVLKTDENDGGIQLSKKRLEVSEHWNEISEAFENKSNIEVKVSRVVKGGVIAAYKEVSGFIPLSQLSNRYVENAEEFLGQVLTVKVTRVEQRKGRAVFSHKQVLSEEHQKQLDEIWETLHVGDIVEGTVMRFTDYGAFVDLGGIDGLLHISEISWGKLKHPAEALKIKQHINVKILSMNREKGKISLGLKQTMPEPWSVIEDNYHIDDVVKGKVVQLKEYGAFVELQPGLDGLVHISKVANKRVSNIADELSIGQEVEVKILDIDMERKRISLSIKDGGLIVPLPEGEKPAEEENADIPSDEKTESSTEDIEHTDIDADMAETAEIPESEKLQAEETVEGSIADKEDAVTDGASTETNENCNDTSAETDDAATSAETDTDNVSDKDETVEDAVSTDDTLPEYNSDETATDKSSDIDTSKSDE